MVLDPQVNIPQRFGYNYGLGASDNFPEDMLDDSDLYLGSEGGFYQT